LIRFDCICFVEEEHKKKNWLRKERRRRFNQKKKGKKFIPDSSKIFRHDIYTMDQKYNIQLVSVAD